MTDQKISPGVLSALAETKEIWRGKYEERLCKMREYYEAELMKLLSGEKTFVILRLDSKYIVSPFDTNIFQSIIAEYTPLMKSAGFTVKSNQYGSSDLSTTFSVPPDFLTRVDVVNESAVNESAASDSAASDSAPRNFPVDECTAK